MNKQYEEEIVYKLDSHKTNCERDPEVLNRYWFKFPETWATSTVNERIIGFRSLWIPLHQRILKFTMGVTHDDDGSTTISFLIYLNVQHHFEDIIKNMQQQIQDHIAKNNIKWLSVDMLDMRYETESLDDETVKIKSFIIDGGDHLLLKLYGMNDDAKTIFNIEDYEVYTSKITCPGIWTRHRCLLRSSISINNSKNYLGYSQKNYNPIKYYKIRCNETRFYIDLFDAHDEEAITVLPLDNKEGLCLEIVCVST